MTTAGTDPINRELIQNTLASIVDEMALTIVRTAHSHVVKEVMDFSTALCDSRGRMVAQGLTLALHLGAIPDAMASVLRAFPDGLRPGDVVILNDPYEGGMHLPDIFLFKPVFAGDRLVGYPAVVAHHTDIGGRIPGSNASDSTEIYQEGLRIPPLKLYEEGQLNKTLIALLRKNVRVPDTVVADLMAQEASCFIAEKGLLEMAGRYGADTLEAYFDELLDHSERMARRFIADLPNGTWHFKDYIDSDGIDPDPITIAVGLTVEGEEMRVSFDGTSSQVKGAINSTFSFTKSAVYLAVRYLMDADLPNNEGYFRPIHITAPQASLVNPVPPAACAARGLTGFRIGDAVFGVLAQMAPDRVFAASEGGNTGISIGGYDQGREPFIFVEFICGAWGGRPDRDGVDGITNPCENLCNAPVELVELDHPIRIERYGFEPNTGGPGRFRGGMALVREWRCLADEATLQVRSDRRQFLPYGLAGGLPGTPSINVLNPDFNPSPLPSHLTATIRKGDLFRHVLPGGGGHGSPLERDPTLVREDVIDGKVSPEFARNAYGVVLHPSNADIDRQATETLRARLKNGSQA